MSGNAEDEAKARLEVAQLYEGMPGQAGKAARYYLAAAEIYRTAGVHQRARELYNKVLQLEPGNAQATQALNNMVAAAGGAPAAAPPRPQIPTSVPLQTPGAPAPAAPIPVVAAASAPAQPSGSGGRVMIPTPWISREPRYVAAARGQLQAPPERRDFPWDPLPTVDPEKVAKRAEERKTVQQEADRKNQKAVPSVFGGEGSGRFSAPAASGGAGAGAGRFGAPPSSGAGKFGAPAAASTPAPAPVPQQPAAQQPPPSRFATGPVDIRGGNRDLADAIRKRLQGG